MNLFKKCKEFDGGANYVIVAVQDSGFVFKFKPNTTLLFSTEERKFMVSSIRYVDEVISYNSIDEVVKMVDFDILAVGPDQNHEAFQNAFIWCRNHGKQVVVFPRTEGISSSYLKFKIKK